MLDQIDAAADAGFPLFGPDAFSIDAFVAGGVANRTFPGEGEFDLDGNCERMRNKGFDGVVSVEILSDAWRAGDLGEFARRAHDSTRRSWP